MADKDSLRSQEGVRVYGSALIVVAPDTATIRMAVSRIEKTPEAAFGQAREGAQGVNSFLQKFGSKDFGSSRASLSTETDYVNGERTFIGYKARLEYRIILRQVDRLEELLTGLIGAGANELTSVEFETTRLKELRADARRRAIVAAREKAELYCQAAGVSTGAVVAIEDVNPDLVSGRFEGHVFREPLAADDAADFGALDPAAITVRAAVQVVYRIGS